MEYRRFGRDLLVRLDKGEELHDAIRSLSNDGISTAAITSGIGRVRGTEIGFLDSDGIYQKMEFERPMELLSMQGNLAPGPDGAFTHIHIVASDDNHVVRGGHLFEATVEVTAEIHMRVLDEDGATMVREATESDFLGLSFCELEG
tara:strand:+ start:1265 stop:1702 length:438 start_codon:yes stop_codon:yes gene_type:complete